MVITDSFLAQSGLLERVRARLRDCTVEVFDQVVPDPPLELVAQGARALAEFRPQAVVAFGGGSPMDCAKAMLEFGKKLGTGADIRFVAVPTTAGTGSEVTSFAVLTDRAKGVKYPPGGRRPSARRGHSGPLPAGGGTPRRDGGHGHGRTSPMPPRPTWPAGPRLHRRPGGEGVYPGLAEPAPRLGNGGGERGQREHAAGLQPGRAIALQRRRLGICHSLAQRSGRAVHLPHGRLNALILPHVIHFNAADGTAAEKYGRLARLCGLAANPRSLAAGLNRLRAQLKLPERLSACGVEGKELTAALDGLAEAAQADLCAPSNPRPAAAEDLKSLLRELA